MTQGRIPRHPKDFGAAGRRLWRSVLTDLELDEHEMALLRSACRIADRLEDIGEELIGAPLTVTNFKGDLVTNPLIVEQRMSAQALAKTLASLRLPTGLTDDGELVRPQRRGSARGAYGLKAVR